MPRPEPRDWPISESVGVFLGVLGLEWLVRGKAELMPALVIAATTGILILLLRRYRRGKH